MEAVRLKVSRYIYCHRQSVSVIGDSLSRPDGEKIWKQYEETLPREGGCDWGSHRFSRDEKREPQGETNMLVRRAADRRALFHARRLTRSPAG